MGRLEGKAAVITGGASGIGEAAVRLFVAEGARVLIADILDGEGTALAAELGGAAVFQHADVSQESDVKAAIDRAAALFGRLDCTFNNAGFGRLSGPIDTIPLEEYEIHMAVLLRGVFLGIKHSARIMKPQGSGSIINTASIAGIHTGYGSLPYSTAKAGVIHMSRVAAVELAVSGVRVNAICPGGIVTPIFGKAFGMTHAEALKTTGTLTDWFSKFQPLRRAGSGSDIAHAALWLASDDSSFVNGHSLVVDGGLTCGLSQDACMAWIGDLASTIGIRLPESQ
jgi:NAD(P)-dependent dehydrogenase (short-subunit alcohol dehydrogenase family)